MKSSIKSVTIIGAGKLGLALAKGLVRSGQFTEKQITLTRRKLGDLSSYADMGYRYSENNVTAVKSADLIIISVGPLDLRALLESLKNSFDPNRQILVSTVTGISINTISSILGSELPVVRIMPNTAAAICQSMTCLSSNGEHKTSLKIIQNIFQGLGATLEINEELMSPATALCASGLAFFLRSIRAASQGGIEIGFHAEDAIKLAAHTAKGAAALLIDSEKHPEAEIDKVTTPKGITIAGLNEMEHQGFSSAMIKAIVTSAEKIEVFEKTKT